MGCESLVLQAHDSLQPVKLTCSRPLHGEAPVFHLFQSAAVPQDLFYVYYLSLSIHIFLKIQLGLYMGQFEGMEVLYFT